MKTFCWEYSKHSTNPQLYTGISSVASAPQKPVSYTSQTLSGSKLYTANTQQSESQQLDPEESAKSSKPPRRPVLKEESN